MKKKINQCTVTLTRKCNLRCDFCYAKRTNYIADEFIELNSLKKVIDFCDDLAIKYLVFTGGEPTMYEYLLEVLDYINDGNKNVLPTIATNGIMFSDYLFLNKAIDKGLRYIDISLKGISEINCKNITGVDCLGVQMKTIKNLANSNIDFTCSLVITKDNVDHYCDVVRLAKENGAKQFSFTFIIDNEESIYKDLAYLERNNPFDLIGRFMNSIVQLNEIIDDWWIEFSFPLCFFTANQLTLLSGRLAAPCHVRKLNGITFDTNLNLIPCNMYFDEKIGNFGTDFESSSEFEELFLQGSYNREMQRINTTPSKECKNCDYYNECRGGCPVIWKNYSFEAVKIFKDKIKKNN